MDNSCQTERQNNNYAMLDQINGYQLSVFMSKQLYVVLDQING